MASPKYTFCSSMSVLDGYIYKEDNGCVSMMFHYKTYLIVFEFCFSATILVACVNRTSTGHLDVASLGGGS